MQGCLVFTIIHSQHFFNSDSSQLVDIAPEKRTSKYLENHLSSKKDGQSICFPAIKTCLAMQYILQLPTYIVLSVILCAGGLFPATSNGTYLRKYCLLHLHFLVCIKWENTSYIVRRCSGGGGRWCMDMVLVIPKCSCVCGSFSPGEFERRFDWNGLLPS